MCPRWEAIFNFVSIQQWGSHSWNAIILKYGLKGTEIILLGPSYYLFLTSVICLQTSLVVQQNFLWWSLGICKECFAPTSGWIVWPEMLGESIAGFIFYIYGRLQNFVTFNDCRGYQSLCSASMPDTNGQQWHARNNDQHLSNFNV